MGLKVKYPNMETVAQHLSRRYHNASLNNFLTDMGSNLHNSQMVDSSPILPLPSSVSYL